jgi:hypothetical protein
LQTTKNAKQENTNDRGMILRYCPAKMPAAVTALLLMGCVQTLRVRDVIDLPPPQEVQAVREQDYVTVKWREPGALQKEDFAGYLLYFAPRSLAATPLAQLPRPLEIAPQLTQFTFALADSSPVFIHMRTRAGRKDVSLPSLPEIMLPPLSGHAREAR